MFSINDASQVGNNTIRLDLTNYALKDDTATKIDIEDLKSKIANKLHTHTLWAFRMLRMLSALIN